MHLGHYIGALENWIKLQKQYDCYFLIADYQALGDYAENVERIKNSVMGVALDWLSVGLDPEESSFVIQSYVPEHAELAMLLSMITPLGMVERNPTLKSEMERLKEISLGFFNYPASQVADILLPKANLVPAGEDQLPHIELTREIARKFNRIYKKEVFPMPEALIGRVPRLMGIDGKAKMSKSLGNCIYLSDSAPEVKKKVNKMYTDPTRIRATDPGHIEGNVVFIYLDAFHPDKAELDNLKELYRQGKVSDVEIKELLAKILNTILEPIRERRNYYLSSPQKISQALLAGTERARKIASKTVLEVREAMGITDYENIKNLIKK